MIRYYLMLIIGLLIVILMTNVWITARTLWDNTLLYSMQLISETQTSVDILAVQDDTYGSGMVGFVLRDGGHANYREMSVRALSEVHSIYPAAAQV